MKAEMNLARRLYPVAGALALATALVSCGGGGGPSRDNRPFEVLSGGIGCGLDCSGNSSDGDGVGSGSDGGDGAGGSLSAMRNVSVDVKQPDGTLLGKAVLKDNLVSLYPHSYSGPFIVTFADDGSGTGECFDEARKAWLSIGAQELHILVPALTHHISANALTEAAYQLALKTEGANAVLTAAQMNTANEAVRAAFNARLGSTYTVSDITNYATPVDDKSVAGALPNTHAGRYGAVLAALPIAAVDFSSGLAAPALAFTRQFVADIVDDAQMNASVTVDAPAYADTVADALAAGLTQTVATYGSSVLPLIESAAGSFSSTSNPGKVWTYGATAGFGGSFTAFTRNVDVGGISMWLGENSDLQTPSVYFNPSDQAVDLTSVHYDPKTVGFHPGRADSMATFRFTVPAAGTYEIAGSTFCQDVDSTSTQVGIFVNGSRLGALLDVTGFGPDNALSFSRTSTLAAGDTVDVSVGNNGNFLNDSTGLVLTIRALP